MPAPALFIGVVSHQGSRFSASQGPRGLAAQLAVAIPSAVVRVNTENLLDEGVLPVTPAMVQATLTAELHLDREWSHYLDEAAGPRWWAVHALRWGRRGWARLRPPGTSMVRRLLNIELSHLDLMRAGVASTAPWVLILEDDAASADVVDCATGMLGLMQQGPRQPAFVNLSKSFSNADLGIAHLLSRSEAAWEGVQRRSVLSAERPVTNTVCAILYRTSFVETLLATMDALPAEPVVPIDWKLNRALMNLFHTGALGPGDCWLVDTPPIDQLSMAST